MRKSVWAAVLSLTPLSGFAQLCTVDDSINSCRQRVDDWFGSSETDVAIESEAKSAVVAANTGMVDQPAQATGSVNDFNPLLQLAADSGGLGNDDEALSINLNNFINLDLPDYQTKLIVQHAALNDQIVTALRDAGAESRVAELEDEFDDFDDVTLTFSYSPIKKNMGRNPELYRDLLQRAFQDARDRIEGTATTDLVRATIDYGRLSNEVLAALEMRDQSSADFALPEGFVLEDTPFKTIETWLNDDGATTGLREATERMRRVATERQRELSDVLNKSWFFTLVDLIDSQPQFFVSAQANSPHELVGPRTVSAKLTWEKGWVSINGLNQRCTDPEEGLLSCLGSYLDEGNNRQMLENGDRIALSLEYMEIDDYTVSLVDDGIEINAPKDKSLVGSFSYGRYVGAAKSGPGKPRVDIAISYEKVDNSTLRQDRFVATATFSQKLGDASILSFGLVYANKPEFRGEVDEEISARLGINYKLGNDD